MVSAISRAILTSRASMAARRRGGKARSAREPNDAACPASRFTHEARALVERSKLDPACISAVSNAIAQIGSLRLHFARRVPFRLKSPGLGKSFTQQKPRALDRSAQGHQSSGNRWMHISVPDHTGGGACA
jgi:hypothetical protein